MKITLSQIEETHLSAQDLIDLGVVLNKYADPVEGPLNNITAELAESVASEDNSLVWFNGEDLEGKCMDGYYPLVEDGEIVGIVDARENDGTWEIDESNMFAVSL